MPRRNSLTTSARRAAGKIVATLTGHSKKVTVARFHVADAGLLFTASADKTVKMWRSGDGGGYSADATVSDHADEVTGLTVHATGAYFATASRDKTWCFYDLGLGGSGPRCLTQVGGEGGGYECAEFHPDGLILGMATSDALSRFWDMKSQSNVHSFEGHRRARARVGRRRAFPPRKRP